MQYLIDRLKEPGTMRSLAVMAFALRGVVPDEGTLQAAVDVSILMLGVVSALMPERKVAS